MSDVAATGDRHAVGFSPRVVLALVAVAVLAFAGLTVLFAYASDLRGREDSRAHALSSSAVGFRGAMIMLSAQDTPAAVSRVRPADDPDWALMVATPGLETNAKDLSTLKDAPRLLIVLPKWVTSPDPRPNRGGFVIKEGAGETTRDATELLAAYAPETRISRRKGETRPQLHGGGAVFVDTTWLPLGPVDALQTLSGPGWRPALVDERGGIVLAVSDRDPDVVVLADPDLLNNHGLANLDNARAGMAIIHALGGDGGVRFDVTLQGYGRGRGLLRLMLEPPWLAATLCGLAVALLMGLQSLARFGPAMRRGRVLALGAAPLVDSSAGLVRMARREAEFAHAYVAVTVAQVLRDARGAAAGKTNPEAAADMARLRGAAEPAALDAEAGQVRTREGLLAFAERLYLWRQEIMRGR